MPVIMGIGGLVIDVGSWYLTQTQLQAAADAAALAGAQDLPNSPSSALADARRLASENASGVTVTSATPYQGNSSEIQVTVSESGSTYFASVFGISAPTVTASAVAENTAGTGSFVYAGSTACNAVSIFNGGGLSFRTTVWSNGGITGENGGPVTVTGHVDVADSLCPFPSWLTPPGPTAVSTYMGWPTPLPTVAQGNLPSSCQSADITIDTPSWTNFNPPGMYCTTGTVNIDNGGNMTFDGYEFVSESTSTAAISVFNGGTDTFDGYCPSSCSAGGAPQTLFYATAGGVIVGNGGQLAFTGDIFAPNGQVSVDAGGGAATGFIEASTIEFSNGGFTTVTGTGPTLSGHARLIA
jgi:Flp pilus assembly protein TadG